MGLSHDNIDGQTPLDELEKEGLRIQSIATHAELNEFEQQNIEHAVQWIMGRSIKADTLFSESFIRLLHKRMFAEVWTWAGEFRRSNKNIGIDKWQIPHALKYLLDDARFWHENNVYSPDELALRFKHRLVSIHCFANGNGRHSRLVADIVVEKLYNLPVFSWGASLGLPQGASSLSSANDARSAYLKAVKAADHGDYGLLLKFARS